ncbi:MAG: gamma-glutamylcyclotransferase [Betaproteobacteria bacterium]|jgi:cation transport protein ChaC|nr:gamma-glutamylcyclotransferase [Betaproteobacteria bacterium]
MIDREFLRSGGLSRALADAEREGLLRLTTPEERQRSREELLARGASAGSDVWVFGYGSLMWNPAFRYAEERPAIVYGYHRRFCLIAPFGRGTRERPGLLLGLDRGGTCRGVAFRIAAAQVEEELDIIWAREKVADGYRPIWVHARTETGDLSAIAFAIDDSLPTYAGRLPQEEIARRIATASGKLGHCADYLEDTVTHLEERGIHDRALTAIRKRVRELRRAT